MTETREATPSIDIHTHAMPLRVLRWLESEGLADLSSLTRDGADSTLTLDPRISGVARDAAIPLPASQWDVNQRIRDMDAQGVSIHAVSLPPFLMASTCLDEGLALEVVRRGNEALAEYVSAAPGRLVALATAPVGMEGSSDEVHRALRQGAAGVAFGTRGCGRELDDPINDGLWELMTSQKILGFVHPSGVPDLARMGDYYLPQLIGYPMETAIAVTRLIMAGTRDRYPFPLVLAHGGGCLPALRGRLDLGWERKALAHVTPNPPSHYVKDLHVDSAVFSLEILQELVDLLGSERVLLGTDFPFELADRAPQESLSGLRISAEERTAIRGGNAARLLGMETQ